MPQNKPISQIVNIIGKYLYKHIDTAYKIEKSPNTVDVYFEIAYQLLPEYRLKEEDEEANVMSINISITTYADKIRVNVIEVSPNERTLGHSIFQPYKFDNLQDGMNIILDKIRTQINKAFQEYEFYF